ncbi:extracellular solute-binding protein [Diaphorobacter aerolatus]|uniref:ABC transporter substrate-binding protein n=1 Tax=Diaphorobacter aerolatus TaxID=1288495 RepID=A0A7H0GQ10_9BURK|nr:extracellular solute-binding protein [Diaphorobacter aerolatus]QNP50376.1 ABC transporter substrate-binding protein [Diaphorobacter aerolatus]
MWGEPALPAGFDHFAYVNVNAPKGGEIRLVSNLRVSTFDKYNPFTVRGNAPAYLGSMMFDSLLTSPLDETGVGYGLLAEDVEVAADGLSATFRLNPRARFHNGKPVLAQDVKFSYDTLVGPHVSPGYKTLLIDVAGVDILGDRSVRFRFKSPNRELPLTVGALPIFSRDWGMEDGKPKPFDQVVMDIPIGSGAYRIGPVNFGKDITYVRDPQYWARDLNVIKGSNNFDRVQVKIYKDNTARLEALKAGEFDLMRIFSAGDWARRVNGKKFDSGELVKGEFQNKLPSGFQSFVLNTRRPVLADRRVREALGLAFDFEWMNRQLFYGSYTRVKGLFGNTMCETTGKPSADELALLEPWRKDLPEAVFGDMYAPPTTDGATSLRDNLRRAQALLKDAGWEVRDGVLRNTQGEAMVLEYLDSSETGIKTFSSWMRNLQKLGVTLKFRAVDFALYQQRLQKFDFDITTIAYQGTTNPGQEFLDVFGSAAADQEDSGNFPGVKNPAVDAMIKAMVSAKTKEQMLPACHALERIIASEHYLIPQYFSGVHRMVYNAWRLERPGIVPPYVNGEPWVIGNWWARVPPLTATPGKP